MFHFAFHQDVSCNDYFFARIFTTLSFLRISGYKCTCFSTWLFQWQSWISTSFFLCEFLALSDLGVIVTHLKSTLVISLITQREKNKSFLLFSGCAHLTAAEVQVCLSVVYVVVLCGLVECLRCFVKGNDFPSSQSTVDLKQMSWHYWFLFSWLQLLFLFVSEFLYWFVTVNVGVYSVFITSNYWSLIDCISCLYVSSSVCICVPVYCVHVPVCMCVYQDELWPTRVCSFSYLFLTIFTVSYSIIIPKMKWHICTSCRKRQNKQETELFSFKGHVGVWNL